MERYYDDESKGFSIEVDEEGKSILLEMVRWTKFAAIIGIVAIVFMILMSILMGMFFDTMTATNPAMAGMGAVGIIIYYFFIAGIMAYPVIMLYRYSISMKAAMQLSSKEKFKQAVRYMKNMFKYYGVLTIILLCLSAVFFIFTIIGVMATRSA